MDPFHLVKYNPQLGPTKGKKISLDRSEARSTACLFRIFIFRGKNNLKIPVERRAAEARKRPYRATA